MRFNQSRRRGVAALLTISGISVGNELLIENASIPASEYVGPTSHSELASASSIRRTPSDAFRLESSCRSG
jgi:hypothetical protein